MELVDYEKNEVILNAFSHAIGAICFIVFGIIFIRNSQSTSEFVAYTVYCISLFIMFFNSTLYHAVPKSKFQYVMRAIDHSSIFLAIAGTYTPILVLGLESKWSTLGLVAIWLFALAGIIIKVIAFSLKKVEKTEKLGLALYLAMGWMAIFFLPIIYNELGLKILLLILLGGLFYTGGVFFYRARTLKYNHFIWHIFILLGAFTHYYMCTLL